MPPASTGRVLLATFGSHGDIHPFLAVALGLRDRGYTPIVATNEHYRAKIEGLGLAFRSCRPDTADPAEDPSLMRRVMDPNYGPIIVVRELVMPAVRAMYEDLDAAAGGGVDLIVSHPLTFAAPLVAERRGVRWASTVLAPMSFLSPHDPPVLPPIAFLARLRGLGPRFHGPLFRFLTGSIRSWSEPYHRLRAELGLPPGGDPLFEGAHSPHRMLALFSPVLGSPQPDWPANTIQTGFPFYDRDLAPEFPADLAAFLDSGPAPIVFTLGTAAVFRAGKFYRHGLEAARRLGRRAVLLIGRDPSNRFHEPLPDWAIAVPYAPFSELFPRAAAIVHQGGVGTTAQGLRSGRPTLIMPYAFDQPDNASRVARLGVSLTLPRKSFRASTATRLLGRLLSEPAFSDRAASVGEVVRREDGTKVACEVLVRMMGSG